MTTKLAPNSNGRRGWVRGEPLKFVRGHAGHGFKNGRYIARNGYVMVYAPWHAMANSKGYVKEHVLVVINALGRPLPEDAVVHHVNEDRSQNSNDNLVVCENRAYHNLLHQRSRALRECGHANWRKCPYCKQYDDPADMAVPGRTAYHRSCLNEYQKRMGIGGKRRTAICQAA